MSEGIAEATPAVKKTRAPRQDYGFNEAAVITKTGKDVKYRMNGKRRSWYESVTGFEGQTVKAYLDAYADSKESPRGWLRFFVQDGAISLVAAS